MNQTIADARLIHGSKNEKKKKRNPRIHFRFRDDLDPAVEDSGRRRQFGKRLVSYYGIRTTSSRTSSRTTSYGALHNQCHSPILKLSDYSGPVPVLIVCLLLLLLLLYMHRIGISQTHPIFQIPDSRWMHWSTFTGMMML